MNSRAAEGSFALTAVSGPDYCAIKIGDGYFLFLTESADELAEPCQDRVIASRELDRRVTSS